MGRDSLVSIVVVTWNSAEYLPRCLAAIERQTYADRELIIVDNASTDGSADHATIRNDTNRGFAAAANQGIRASSGALVLLVNPDCFLEPEYCARLVEALGAAGETTGAATGKLLLADGSGRIDSKGIRMTRTGRHLDIDQGSNDPALGPGPSALARAVAATSQGPRPNAEGPPQEVFGVSGAAPMYRRTLIDDCTIDGEFFDEDFFAYREDADLAWRARLFGWKALYVPGALAYHVRRVTPEARRSLPAFINMHSVKNRFLLRAKNQGAYLAMRNAPFELFRDAVTIAAVLTVERTSIPALTWLWRNRARIAAKRRAVQSRRRVSDRDLVRWFR